MIILRLVRVAAIALGFAALFALSRAVTAARGGEDVPGISWALGVRAVLFRARAVVSERMRAAEPDWQRDFLWGLGSGALLIIIVRAFG